MADSQNRTVRVPPISGNSRGVEIARAGEQAVRALVEVIEGAQGQYAFVAFNTSDLVGIGADNVLGGAFRIGVGNYRSFRLAPRQVLYIAGTAAGLYASVHVYDDELAELMEQLKHGRAVV